MANTIIGNGDVTAVGVVRGAKVRVPSLADFELGTTSKTGDLAKTLADTVGGLSADKIGVDSTFWGGLATNVEGAMQHNSYEITGIQGALSSLEYMVSGKLDAVSMANGYSATRAYAVGDFCTHESKPYMCNTAIASPGEAWTAEHWTLANLSTLFTSVDTSTDPAASGALSNAVLDKGIVKVVNTLCANLDPNSSSTADIIRALKGGD